MTKALQSFILYKVYNGIIERYIVLYHSNINTAPLLNEE